MLLRRIFQIFITFVHILCFSGSVSSGLRAQCGPQLTSALGPGMYWIIIIGHNPTDSNFNRPTVRRGADDIVAAQRLAMLFSSSESVDKQYSELHAYMAWTPPREGKATEAWNIVLADMKNPWIFKTQLTQVSMAVESCGMWRRLACRYQRFGETSCPHFLTHLHCITFSVSSAQLKPGEVREFNPFRTLITT
jgi:hypothetical protein